MSTSRTCPPRRTGARTLAALALGALTIGTALTGGAAPASAASASAPMMFGAVASTKDAVAEHEASLGGSTLHGLRVYKSWGDPLFGTAQTWARDTGHTLFMSIRSKRQDGTVIPWAQIAAAQPGSPLYNDMLSQAAQIKAFRSTTYIAFNHEPEAAEARAMGSSAEFVAAYQKVESVWKAAGVTNVRYVFAATAFGFVRKDAYKAANYYPGDDFVDDIGADGYNWADCRTPGGKWKELATVIEGQRQFGLLHPSKGLMLYEFGSAEDPKDPGHKAQWLRNVLTMFQQPAYSQYRVALSWEGRNFTGGGPSCGFDYKSSPQATQAWVDLAHAPAMAATTIG
jgi:hypothetical protein